MDTPSMVSSQVFVAAMTARWTSLGNISSPRLEALWGVMADTFNAVITGTLRFDMDTTWRVLEPPTGSGKTQGLCVYAALAMEANTTATAPLGMLVVTRTIAQADEIVATITELVADKATNRMVVARHSDNKTATEVARRADVLVICHEAYTRALEANRWQDFVEWDGGRRSLSIIDEALTGVIAENRLLADHVLGVVGMMTPTDEADFSEQFTALKRIQTLLDRLGNSLADAQSTTTRMSVAWASGDYAVPDMSGLRQRMATKRYDRTILRRDDARFRADLAARNDKAIVACEELLRSWAYYARHFAEATLNSAKLIIPPGLPGVVVLDATAANNFLWTLLGDRVERVVIPSGARSYANVTLHVGRTADGLGKTTMTDRAATRLPRLLDNIQSVLGPDRKVLLVCHKDVAATAKTFEPSFESYDVAWYGAIDGKNIWSEYDTAVIFGLHRMSDTWSRNAFMALQGLQDDQWLNEPAQWQQFTDVRREMERRQLTVSIVQAVNRVRCRRVIDGDGNCASTDLFLMLPSNSDGDDILEHLFDEMPGIKIVDWDHTLDGPKATVRRGSVNSGLMIMLSGNKAGGSVPMSDVQAKLGLSSNSLRKLKATLASKCNPLSVAVAGMGYHYVTEGRGPRTKAYLVHA